MRSHLEEEGRLYWLVFVIGLVLAFVYVVIVLMARF